MTTIAIKNGVVAADTQSNAGYILPTKEVKIKKCLCRFHPQFMNKEIIIGGSGHLDEVVRFMDWIEHDGSKETYIPPENSTLILVDNEGIWLFNSYYKPSNVGQTGAFGSGGNYAMGAMYAGVNPDLAVAIASNLDPDTGGEIMVLELGK